MPTPSAIHAVLLAGTLASETMAAIVSFRDGNRLIAPDRTRLGINHMDATAPHVNLERHTAVSTPSDDQGDRCADESVDS